MEPVPLKLSLNLFTSKVTLQRSSVLLRLPVMAILAASLTGTHAQAPKVTSHFDPTRTEQTVSAGAFGWLTLRNPTTGVTQGTSSSAGISAAYQQQLSPFVGYRANFGWTRIDEIYTGTAYQSFGNTTYQVQTKQTIPANVFELSTTYVIQQPRQKRQVRAFAEAGPGVLMFIPTKAPFAGYSSYRAAAVAGAGVLYQPTERWGLRLAYRGYFYKNPDFAAQTQGGTRDKYFTYTSGPTLSVSYRFR